MTAVWEFSVCVHLAGDRTSNPYRVSHLASFLTVSSFISFISFIVECRYDKESAKGSISVQQGSASGSGQIVLKKGQTFRCSEYTSPIVSHCIIQWEVRRSLLSHGKLVSKTRITQICAQSGSRQIGPRQIGPLADSLHSSLVCKQFGHIIISCICKIKEHQRCM